MANKKVIIIRSNTCIHDSRVQRIKDLYKSIGIFPIVLGWNRNLSVVDPQDNLYLYEGQSNFGKGMSEILSFIKWFIFVCKFLFINRKKYQYIHACDLDSLIPSFIFRILNKKIIYDIFDSFAESRNIPYVFKIVIMLSENLLIYFSNLTILPDEIRKNQFFLKWKKIFIIENVPNNSFVFKKKDTVPSDVINIAYVGTFGRERGIEDLLEVVAQNKNIILTIAGNGHLENTVKSYSSDYANINYKGKVTPSEGLSIIHKADLNVGFYYLNGKKHGNHISACPNKYYETLLTGTPLITNVGPLFGNKLTEKNIGYVIEQGLIPLNEFLISNVLSETIVEYSKNATSIWEKEYKNYYFGISIEFEKQLCLL